MKVLTIVDMQYDFISGSLEVPGAHLALDNANQLIRDGNFDVIIASRDWHPKDHCSFEENGGTWSRHCVARTLGATIMGLAPYHSDFIVSKGMKQYRDEYSAWPMVKRCLMDLGPTQMHELHFCGLATDVCVFETIAAAKRDKWCDPRELFLHVDACAGINEEGTNHTLNWCTNNGIKLA